MMILAAVLHALSDLSKSQENNNDSKKHIKDTLSNTSRL